jgi:hypothetical protein
MDGLVNAYCARFDQESVFLQKETCIENPKDPNMTDGYSYISLMTKEKFKPGVRFSFTCDFEGKAAPLMVMAREMYEENGMTKYGNYQEVVLFKNGLNVWNLWQQEDGKVVYHKLLGIEENVTEKELHTVTVDILQEVFRVTFNGHSFYLRVNHGYEDFHLGITGCEGVCRFYDMEITQL